MMNVRGLAKIIPFLCIAILFSCTSKDEEIRVAVGSYQRLVIISSNGGNNDESLTKAFNEGFQFTAVYDADYVYIHSFAENEGVADKWVRIPIQNNLPACGEDCQGFQLDIEVMEDGYLITGDQSSDGSNSMKFASDEIVYLSSTEDETWEGTTSEASPLTDQTVLVRDDDQAGDPNYQELYRSASEYSMADLINGTNGVRDEIMMERKCSAFLVCFLFTDLDNPISMGNSVSYNISPESWEDQTGAAFENWYGKIYLGKCFGDTYDIENETSGFSNGSDGYYASYNQEYVPFSLVEYLPGMVIGGQTSNYYGYGVRTTDKYLVTPYDVDHDGNMTFYAFIKKGDNSDPTSDVGSKYFSYEFTVPAPAFNTTSMYVVVCDVDELVKGFASTAGVAAVTRSDSAPQEFDIQPVEVICVQEE